MPSGTTVEELCGQPEQKYGVRTATSCVSASTRCASFSRATWPAIALVGRDLEQALADADRDVVGIERALDREQPVALLVLLADADRLVGGAVELLAHLHLDQRALLLDHDDELEALRELLRGPAAERPRAADLVEAQAEVVALDLVDAELVERLAHVEIALAGGDDADLRVAAARGDDLVELVGAHEGEHGVALVVVQPRLHAEDRVAAGGC